MGIWFLRIAVVYVVIGVIFGVVMGVTQHFGFADAHAHINLLGWVTGALAGVVYTLFPAAGTNRLAVAHFWFYTIGVPIFAAGLVLMGAGLTAQADPLLNVGALLVVIGVVIFAVNVWLNVRQAARG